MNRNHHRYFFLSMLTSLTFGLTPLAQAQTNSLGLEPSLNLLSFGDFIASSSDVQGHVAVAGNASITAYSINTVNGSQASYSGTGLAVGGNLTFSNGSVWGNTVVGGGLINGSGATFHGSTQFGASSGQLGVNFAAEQLRLTGLSQSLDGLANTGAGTLLAGNTFAFDANGANLAVFDLASSDVLKNLRLDNLGANTTVILNVHGQTIDFGPSHGYDNFAGGRVLFNLPDATLVTFAGGVSASFLAPLAQFNGSWGAINGQVVVGSWNGTTQVNDAPFAGNIAAVPEPETYALMLAGLMMVVGVARRRSAV